MANEAVLLIQTGFPVNFTVADGTGIEKGAILQMTDPNTASAASAVAQAVAGIAAVEKIASDGVTSLAVHRTGQFKVLLSGSATVGNALVTSGLANAVEAAAVNAENILGTALETGSNGEYIRIELNPRGINLA